MIDVALVVVQKGCYLFHVSINRSTRINVFSQPPKVGRMVRKQLPPYFPCSPNSILYSSLFSCSQREPGIAVTTAKRFQQLRQSHGLPRSFSPTTHPKYIDLCQTRRASSIEKTQRTCTYMVRCTFGKIFSVALRPVDVAHVDGGSVSGACASGASVIVSNCCRSRISINDISLYAN